MGTRPAGWELSCIPSLQIVIPVIMLDVCIVLYGFPSTFKDISRVGSMQLVRLMKIRPLSQKEKLGLLMGQGFRSVTDGFVTRTRHFSLVVQGSVLSGSMPG